MSAIDQTFRDLRAADRRAFIPFVTAGDPDLAFTAELVRQLSQQGVSLCEIGIPYSDPIADGPVIQASYTRALEQRIKLEDILQCLARLAGKLATPLVTMVSYAIVFRHGLERYVCQAREAGVAGAIVPDLPVEESEPLARICRREDFSLIQLVTPTTSRQRALRIAENTTGFLYYVSVTGITGERRELPKDLLDNVAWLRGQTELPICIGFGISQPDQVRMLRDVSDGLIVGSALMRRIAQLGQLSREEVISDLAGFVDQMLQALNEPLGS